MKEIRSETILYELGSIDNIDNSEERDLCRTAMEAIESAYAPYSNYRVGAAVLLGNGKIVTGSNQENAVFPLGLCAERVAIFSACDKYPNVPINAIAIQTFKNLKEGEYPGFPCGSCRQCMIEMEYRFDVNMKIYVMGKSEKVYCINSAKELLPFAFSQKDL